MLRAIFGGMLAVLSLAACNTVRETDTPRSATEELLVSTAADRAAEKLGEEMPPHHKVFLDTANFDALDGKYAINTVRDALMRHGEVLVDAKKDSDMIVEIRSGSSAIDDRDELIGVPATTVPVPLSSTSLAIPKIALYDDTQRQGIAKFAATGYDSKTNALIASTGPQYGYAHTDDYTLLILFGWTRGDLIPLDKRDPGRITSPEYDYGN